jgi:hypothetical protein
MVRRIHGGRAVRSNLVDVKGISRVPHECLLTTDPLSEPRVTWPPDLETCRIHDNSHTSNGRDGHSLPRTPAPTHYSASPLSRRRWGFFEPLEHGCEWRGCGAPIKRFFSSTRAQAGSFADSVMPNRATSQPTPFRALVGAVSASAGTQSKESLFVVFSGLVN